MWNRYLRAVETRRSAYKYSRSDWIHKVGKFVSVFSSTKAEGSSNWLLRGLPSPMIFLGLDQVSLNMDNRFVLLKITHLYCATMKGRIFGNHNMLTLKNPQKGLQMTRNPLSFYCVRLIVASCVHNNRQRPTGELTLARRRTGNLTPIYLAFVTPKQ